MKKPFLITAAYIQVLLLSLLVINRVMHLGYYNIFVWINTLYFLVVFLPFAILYLYKNVTDRRYIVGTEAICLYTFVGLFALFATFKTLHLAYAGLLFPASLVVFIIGFLPALLLRKFILKKPRNPDGQLK
jgi:hypothetical protein